MTNTPAIILQGRQDGTFVGIHVVFDGYLEGLGRTLINAYPEPHQIVPIINRHRPLDVLGLEPTIVSPGPDMDEQLDALNTVNGFEWRRYTVADNDPDNQVYYVAPTFQDIQLGRIYGYDSMTSRPLMYQTEEGEILPSILKVEDAPIYIQLKTGEWYYVQNGSEPELLVDVLQKKS